MRIVEGINEALEPVKKPKQIKDSLHSERVSTKLSHNDVVWCEPVTSDNASKEKSLDSLNRGPVRLQERGAPNNRTIEDSRLDQGVKKRHLSHGVLEVVSKILSLKNSKGAELLVDFGLHG